jgi:hypothetical protein
MRRKFDSCQGCYNCIMKNLYEFLFNRTLSQSAMNRPSSDLSKTIYSQNDIVVQVPYLINEHGYRSEPFSKDNDVLILGCSQTYGSGLPNEFTWADFFCKNINKKYSRLACPGYSINGQVYKAFNYFKEIGKPKIVLGLFPLYRLEYPAIPGEFVHPHGSLNTNEKPGSKELEKAVTAMAYFNYDVAQFSKAPHDPAYVIPKEFTIFYNFMFIKMLEEYCNSNNIIFIWSVYENFEDIQKYLENHSVETLKNFLKTSDIVEIWDEELLSKRSEVGESVESKLQLFAADYNQKIGMGHWGIRTNKKIAERFAEKYKEISNDQ